MAYRYQSILDAICQRRTELLAEFPAVYLVVIHHAFESSLFAEMRVLIRDGNSTHENVIQTFPLPDTFTLGDVDKFLQAYTRSEGK